MARTIRLLAAVLAFVAHFYVSTRPTSPCCCAPQRYRLGSLSALLLCTFAFVLPAHAANFSVTITADSGTGTLRDALAQANANADADTISFALPVGAQTITLTSAALPISNPVTIQGPGAGALTISGNNTLGLF